MKKALLFLTLLLMSAHGFAQKPNLKIIGIEAGAYLTYPTGFGTDGFSSNMQINTAYINILFPTKYNNLNWIIGLTGIISNGDNDDYQSHLNGIGLYGG